MDLFDKATPSPKPKKPLRRHLSLLHPADRKRRDRGDLQGTPAHHVRLEQLPRPDDRPTRARGGDPGDQAIRHELHGFALSQRHPGDARAARARAGGLRRQGSRARLLHGHAGQPRRDQRAGRPRRLRHPRQGRPRQPRRRRKAELRRDQALRPPGHGGTGAHLAAAARGQGQAGGVSTACTAWKATSRRCPR